MTSQILVSMATGISYYYGISRFHDNKGEVTTQFVTGMYVVRCTEVVSHYLESDYINDTINTFVIFNGFQNHFYHQRIENSSKDMI